VWFTNPVGTNLVMFNLYLKKKTQRREINEVRSRALGHFLNFAGVIFIAYVGRKKNEMDAWWEI
jgi:hypothetical protein